MNKHALLKSTLPSSLLVLLAAFAACSSPILAAADSTDRSGREPAATSADGAPKDSADISNAGGPNAGGLYTAGTASQQVLAHVGSQVIRAGDLDTALASAPFATAFMSLNVDDQARARGDMLQRLIGRQLLLLEADAQGIRETAAFRKELEVARTSLLAKASLDAMGEQVEPDPQRIERLRSRLSKDPDALEAALSTLQAETYKASKQSLLADLRKRYHLKTYPERSAGAPTAVVAEGDGFRIHPSDLATEQERKAGLDTVVLFDRLQQAADTALLARAAQEDGLDVSAELQAFADDLAIQHLLREREHEWLPDEAGQRAWFEAHPRVSRLPSRWHVGQIVVDSRKQADELRQRIVNGESLFELAGKYSIDPYGRQHAGDMGWISEGQGSPELEKSIASLEDGDVSPVIKTAKGYHLITVTERRPGRQRSFDEMKDAVRQAMVAEKMPDYLASLEARYTVSLN